MKLKSFTFTRREFLTDMAACAATAAFTPLVGDCFGADSGTTKRGFRRRGFYLHGSWVMEHPFAVRSWSR